MMWVIRGVWLLALVPGLCSVSSLYAADANWPNEPVGFTRNADCAFTGTVCNIPNIYSPGLPYISLPAAGQLSPTSAIDSVLCAGCSEGNGGLYYNFPTVREVYFGTWWATNADFEGSVNGSNKMFMFRNPAVDNSLLHWGGLPNSTRQVRWFFQTTYNECHISGYVGDCYTGPGTSGTGYLVPNVSSACNIAAGSGWHKLELYLKASTTASSQNGIVRIWCDGQLSTNYTNANLLPNGLTEFIVNSGWDGSGPFACPGVRNCAKAWHHYFDHMVISTGTGGGGGVTPPAPPPPPPLPPNMPTNLRVQ